MKRTALMSITLAALAATLAWHSPAQAQYGGESGVVSGNGIVTISRQPETMRVTVAIQGKGGTLKDALAAVKTRTEAAKKQVAALGANKDTIKVESPKINTQQADQQQAMMQRQMQRAMMQQMNKTKKAGKKDKEAAKPAEPVLVAAMFTAEWKLDAKTPEDLLIAVHGLQEKIKAADLAGMKDAEKLSPEQEEMLEEMEQAQQFNYNGNETPKPGEPIFMFVSRIPEDEREKAIAAAFQKAKTQASKLAKAAGTELGALKSLSSTSRSGNANNYNQYNSRAWQAMQMAGLGQSDDDNEADGNSTEALGVEPGPVKFHVTVMAAFDLGSKK
ncbi:MAG TPA: SIMPL domain-containing protein [Planctomycetaceae bacterium]|jgi:uncharacterized protein YggE